MKLVKLKTSLPAVLLPVLFLLGFVADLKAQSTEEVFGSDFKLSTGSDMARQQLTKAFFHATNYNWPQAIDAARAALDADPHNAFASLVLGILQANKHTSPAGWKTVSNEKSVTSLGETMMITAWDAATGPDHNMAPMENLIATYPDFLGPRMLAIPLYMAKGDTAQADAHIKEAVKLQPGYPSVQRCYGFMLLRHADFEGARQSFEKYMQLLPDHPGPYQAMGDFYRKTGNPEKALEYYEKAYSMSPLTMRDAREKADAIKDEVAGG